MATTTIKNKITVSAVQNLLPDQILWDTDLKGFGARRRKTTTTYIVKTRINGRQRWISIGQHGPWTPATARKEAMRLLSDASSGVDTVAEKKRSAAQPTFAEMEEEFTADYVCKLKPRTQSDYRRLFDRYILPKMGKLKVADIARADIAAFHRGRRHTPRTANYCLALISKSLSWAEEMGYRPLQSNPCFGFKKYAENSRKRYLSPAELGRLGKALTTCETAGAISWAAAAAIRLLIFTGARQSEILTLEWGFVDLQHRRLLLPDSKTGEKIIALYDQAITIIACLPRLVDNPYVIIGGKYGSHLVNIRKPWGFVRKEANLDDVRLHDLRHSFASVGVNSGASLPMIGSLLGHSQAQTTARYAHVAASPAHQLNQEIGDAIAEAMNGTDQEVADHIATATKRDKS